MEEMREMEGVRMVGKRSRSRNAGGFAGKGELCELARRSAEWYEKQGSREAVAKDGVHQRDPEPRLVLLGTAVEFKQSLPNALPAPFEQLPAPARELQTVPRAHCAFFSASLACSSLSSRIAIHTYDTNRTFAIVAARIAGGVVFFSVNEQHRVSYSSSCAAENERTSEVVVTRDKV